MDTEHRTDHACGGSTITTSGTTTTVTLAPRTRDVVVRGLHTYLASPASTCNLHSLLPPELADVEPGTPGSGNDVGETDVRNEVRQNARLYAAVADLTAGHALQLPGAHRVHDLEVIVSSGRAEVGRQLTAEPAEQTAVVAVLADLDRIQRHANVHRLAAAIDQETR